MIEKYINDNNEVAVIWSPDYGAGWSTWNTKELAFDKRIVEWFLKNCTVEMCNPNELEISNIDNDALKDFCESLGYKNVYIPSQEFIISWVPKGTKIRITEYDGAEKIEVFKDDLYTSL